MTTTTITTTRKYSDLDLDFSRNPNTNDVSIKKQDEAVKRSIRNLVFTQHYERLFHPEIGCKVYRLLFENIDGYTALEIQKSIEEVINNFEPRAGLNQVLVQPDEDHNGFNVDIHFTIKNVNAPVTLSFYLERAR